ncbi:UNVERIFIED_ORG: hypothetical protein J2W85_007041 [Ensifer adhaerens]|nr:hypothetical protein [Ensifer adhaerens]
MAYQHYGAIDEPSCAQSGEDTDRIKVYPVMERSPEEISKRRALRAERRQRQRLANSDRAEKMHVVRLAKEEIGRPFTAARTPMNGIHIGCSGWYYWHWKGQFYPTDALQISGFLSMRNDLTRWSSTRRSIPGRRSRR